MRLPLAALAFVAGLASEAAADDRLAAVAASPADDARRAVLVGPGGQVYEPDGKGAWARTHAGGTGDAITTAVPAGGGMLIAGVADGANAHAPPYRWSAGQWSARHLVLKTRAVVARGSRPVAAAGKQVWTLDRGVEAKLPDAPGAVSEIGAGEQGIAIVTDKGAFRLDGKSWRALADVPRGAELASERWAWSTAGATDLKSGKTLPWPTRVTVTTAAPAPGDSLVAAGVAASMVDVVVVKGGKLDHDSTPAPGPDAVVAGVTMDGAGRIVVALRDGHVLVREGGTWVTTEVRDAVPAPMTGSPPALTR